MGKVKGLKEFLVFTEKIADDLEEQAIEVVKESTLETEKKAKQLAPVDTGYMRNSINSTFTNGGKVGTVAVGADYAIFNEFGTSKIPAQPFMFPAFNQEKEEFLKKMNNLKVGE